MGLSAQRIYQDLVEEHGFTGSYDAVKCYVGRLRKKQPQRVWRMECQPGEEMQVDFGLGAPIVAMPSLSHFPLGLLPVLLDRLPLHVDSRNSLSFGNNLIVIAMVPDPEPHFFPIA